MIKSDYLFKLAPYLVTKTGTIFTIIYKRHQNSLYDCFFFSFSVSFSELHINLKDCRSRSCSRVHGVMVVAGIILLSLAPQPGLHIIPIEALFW